MKKQFDYFVAAQNEERGDLVVILHNVSHRYAPYGDMPVNQYPVRIAHYRAVNPSGDFAVDLVCGEIREYFDDDSYEVVAKSGI